MIVVMPSSMSGIISYFMRSVAHTEAPTRATANIKVIQRLIRESLVSRCIIYPPRQSAKALSSGLASTSGTSKSVRWMGVAAMDRGVRLFFKGLPVRLLVAFQSLCAALYCDRIVSIL